jgi:hypothetical protein
MSVVDMDGIISLPQSEFGMPVLTTVGESDGSEPFQYGQR